MKIKTYANRVETNCDYCGHGFAISSRFHDQLQLRDMLKKNVKKHYKSCWGFKENFREERLSILLDNKDDNNSKSKTG